MNYIIGLVASYSQKQKNDRREKFTRKLMTLPSSFSTLLSFMVNCVLTESLLNLIHNRVTAHRRSSPSNSRVGQQEDWLQDARELLRGKTMQE
jgi:hypothetical protein